MELWSHQRRTLDDLQPKLEPGNTICVTAPTGSGKTQMMVELLRLGVRTVLYTNRKMLLEQTARKLLEEEIQFGIRAAGYPPQLRLPIQLSSIQTEDSRTIKNGKWPLHDADLILIDEAHVNKESTASELIRQHLEKQATVVGFTATPLGIGHIYRELVVAAGTRELQEQGVLVRAIQYGPDEPDLRNIKRTKTGEYKQADIVKAVMTYSIFGRVLDHWHRLNPEQLPTILFAPGVKESIWFAEELSKSGVNAAHIDGNDVWLDGKYYESDNAARDHLKAGSESGDIKIVCNRFVMREGIDWPHLYHGIFATIFGSLTSFLQSGGRLLRSFPGKEHCIIQDHGGNWHRHGSLNSDRDWALDRTDYMVTEAREERLRSRKEPEPICCPKCFALRLSGPNCPQCGHESHARSRIVIQRDGSLKEMRGDIYKPRREYKKPGAAEKWKSYYFRCKKAGMTFNAARGLFAKENNWLWPPKGLPWMPTDELDWFREIGQVPRDRLTQPERPATAAAPKAKAQAERRTNSPEQATLWT